MGVFLDEDDFETEYDNFDETAVYDVKIKVIGVGGGGCNALAYMAKLYDKEAKELEAAGGDVMSDLRNKIEFIAVNTDVAALRSKDKTLMRRIQIGKKTCKGRGAGGHPEVAAEAAKENADDLRAAIEGASIVFISAGMGGGTGTGAAPVVAEIAQEMNIITVGVVTKPFEYEREHKMNQAIKGIDEMRKHVDSLVIIPNEKLLQTSEKSLSFKQAFAMVDNVLYSSVKIISDVAYASSVGGIIGTDFADLCSTLSNSGDAHIAFGSGSGENKIQDAVSQVINSPLLETSIAHATKLLVNVTLPGDGAINDLDDIVRMITEAADPSADVIQGVNQDESLSDTISIAVIATGFKQGAPEIKSTFNSASAAPQPAAAKPAAAPSGVTLASAGSEGARTDNDEITTSKNSDDLSKIIQNTLGNLQEKERFSVLQDIFDSRNRNK